jgi:EpsI family protein
VNRYVVEKGGEKVLVLYWYQTSTRVVAKELAARFYLAADSVRLNRSDTALVRIMTSGLEDDTYQDSLTHEFASHVYTTLRKHIQ